MNDPTLDALLKAYAGPDWTDAMRLVIADRLEDLGDVRADAVRKAKANAQDVADMIRAEAARQAYIRFVHGEAILCVDKCIKEILLRCKRKAVLALFPDIIEFPMRFSVLAGKSVPSIPY